MLIRQHESCIVGSKGLGSRRQETCIVGRTSGGRHQGSRQWAVRTMAREGRQ